MQLVAEVLLERAESKGLKLLGSKLEDLICDNSIKALLPRTCEMMATAQVKDLLSGGRALIATVARDLVEQFEWSQVCDDLAESCQRLADLGVRVLAGERLSIDSELRQIALGAVDSPAFDLLRPVIAECTGYGKCDEARIAALIQETVPQSGQGAVRIVADVLLALGPDGNDTQALQRLQSLARAVLDMAAYNLSLKANHGFITVHPYGQTDTAIQLIESLFKQDLGGFAVAALQLKCPQTNTTTVCKTLRKVAQFGIAIGANFTSTEAKPEDKKAARESRKAAINALIDTMTSWNERRGDWILSLGASAGWAGGGAARTDLSADNWVAQTQPTIAAGVALSYLTRGDSSFVFHIQLSPIDIGTYARAREGGTKIQPEDVVRPTLSVGAGVLPKGWNDPIILSGQVGYAISRRNSDETPATPGDPVGETRPFFLGAAISAYFSFFDMN